MVQYQVATTKLRHSLYSLTDSSGCWAEDEESDPPLRPTPLEKLTTDMCKDEKTIKELIVGRRVGFYKVRGEIGCGTFSRVKLAFHALTKGGCSGFDVDHAGFQRWFVTCDERTQHVI